MRALLRSCKRCATTDQGTTDQGTGSNEAGRRRNGTFEAPPETSGTRRGRGVGRGGSSDEDAEEEEEDANVDEYGFVIDSAAVAASASGTSTQKRAVSAREERFWSKVRAMGEREFHETVKRGRDTRDAALKRAIRCGVPSDLRRETWFGASGGKELMDNAPSGGYYEKLLVMNQDEKVVDQIELDLERTFPANRHYEHGEDGKKGNDVLRRILCAYARHNRKTGYCQGMNYIAAFLWLVMGDEEKAFWTFTALLDIVLPSDVHARDIKGTISQYKILHRVLYMHAPKVDKHLRQLDVDLVMIASKWLLCLFVESFPSTTAARVLDCIMFEGEKVWFRVVIAMIKMNEREILECTSLPDVMLCLKEAYSGQFDADGLLSYAFNNISMSNVTIKMLRQDIAREMVLEAEQKAIELASRKKERAKAPAK